MALLAAAGVTSLPPVTADMLVVFLVVLLALVLFVSEVISVDATALLILVVLVILQPWTGISPRDGIAGFSNPATITVLAMLILSEGIRQTGLVQILGDWLASFAREDRTRQLASTLAVGGIPSGFINNTPVVAMLVPVIADLARRGRNSPSKLLIPLSYASMMGGMLTLIGTSTNILASNVSDRLLGHPFGMFEFTHLGLLVFALGATYLLLFAPRLLPERVNPEETYLEEYGMEDYLTEFTIGPEFARAGGTVREFEDRYEGDVDVLMLVREDQSFMEPLARKSLRVGDRVMIRTNFPTLQKLIVVEGLHPGPVSSGSGDDLETRQEQRLVEVVVTSGSGLAGQTLRRSSFLEGYDAHILAYRTGGETLHQKLEDIVIQPGDTLLLSSTESSVNRLAQERDVIVAQEAADPGYKRARIPYVVGVMAGVVGLAAAGILPILISSLLGVVALVLGGVIQLGDIYNRVDWSVVILLAGVIPLGQALENSGAARMLGDLIALTGAFLPAAAVLWLFYLVTGLLTNILSNNASVVLMLPVGVETALQIGASPFAFVMAVTFAASTAFLSPIGYQTNLFVYGPGGYRVRDYVLVGAPLQFLLSLVTTAGIVSIWGL